VRFVGAGRLQQRLHLDGSPRIDQRCLNRGRPTDSTHQFAKPSGRIAGDDPSRCAAANLDETVWIAESVHDAQQYAYVGPINVEDGPFTLTTKYRADARQVAEGRIVLAGARLGNVLNAELK
jgi:hypothetical protein